MISINMIKFHLVTASFNNKVTCAFGSWRMQGQSGTFIQGITEMLKVPP